MEKTTDKPKKKTSCRHYIGSSFRLAVRYILHAQSHRHDSTYHRKVQWVYHQMSIRRLIGPRTEIYHELHLAPHKQIMLYKTVHLKYCVHNSHTAIWNMFFNFLKATFRCVERLSHCRCGLHVNLVLIRLAKLASETTQL